MAALSISDVFGVQDLASLSARRRLPGAAGAEEPVRVEVRVRSYDDVLEVVPVDAAAAPWSQVGAMPVGTLLDCYV